MMPVQKKRVPIARKLELEQSAVSRAIALAALSLGLDKEKLKGSIRPHKDIVFINLQDVETRNCYRYQLDYATETIRRSC